MKSRPSSKQIAAIAVAVVLAGGAAFLWARRPAGREKAGGPAGAAAGQAGTPSVKLYQVEKSSFTDVVGGLVGTIKGDTIELAYSGPEEQLIAVHVRVGQPVKRGSLLFELDHARSGARKSQAEVAYQRMSQLRAAGGATAQDVKEAKAAYDIATKDYTDTYVRSPKNGTVSDVNKQVGETVSRNEVLGVVVSNEDRLVMETGVVEGQIEKIVRGQKALVEVEALGREVIEGTVLGVSREVSTTGRTGTVHIALPDDVQKKLRPGLSARARIVTYSNETLVIPFQAFDAESHKAFVYENGEARPRTLDLGHVTHDFYEVVSGLALGDRVVKDLVANPVKEGDKISPDGDDDTYAGMTKNDK
jgi:RND family efflux transporter MFP subunit